MVTQAEEQDPYECQQREDDDIWSAVAEEAEHGEDMPEEGYYDDDYCELEAEMANGTELTTALEEMAEQRRSLGDISKKKTMDNLVRARGLFRDTIGGQYKPWRPSSHDPTGGRGWSGRGRKGNKGAGKGSKGRKSSPSSPSQTPKCDDCNRFGHKAGGPRCPAKDGGGSPTRDDNPQDRKRKSSSARAPGRDKAMSR